MLYITLQVEFMAMLMINIQVSCDLLWKPGNQKVVGSGPSRSDPWAFTFVSLIKTPLVIPGGTCPVKTFMMPFYDRKLNYWKSFPPALVLRWWIANLLLLYLLFLNVNEHEIVVAIISQEYPMNTLQRDGHSGSCFPNRNSHHKENDTLTFSSVHQ